MAKRRKRITVPSGGKITVGKDGKTKRIVVPKRVSRIVVKKKKK